jgi:hypothetical protein
LTVLETNTSLGPASAATRAPTLHGDSSKVVVHQLNLTSVQASPDLNAEQTPSEPWLQMRAASLAR